MSFLICLNHLYLPKPLKSEKNPLFSYFMKRFESLQQKIPSTKKAYHQT